MDYRTDDSITRHEVLLTLKDPVNTCYMHWTYPPLKWWKNNPGQMAETLPIACIWACADCAFSYTFKTSRGKFLFVACVERSLPPIG